MLKLGLFRSMTAITRRFHLVVLWLVPVLLGLVLVGNHTSSTSVAEAPIPAGQREDWSFDDFRSALHLVDDRGMVNYVGLKADRASLDRFATQLAQLPRQAYESWDLSDKISFWINAYNGLTLLAIINNYPIKASFFKSLRFPKNSIRQISGIWNRLQFEIMGKPTTLDDIEHKILRKEFEEPRIHFALVCAAMGCPPLRNEPYRGDKLNEQLNEQARRFLSSPEKFRIDRTSDVVYLSKILDWYGQDFTNKSVDASFFGGHSPTERAVLDFVSGYLSDADAEYLRRGTYRIDYLEYDWSLNEQRTN
jgi:hypothetical protein